MLINWIDKDENKYGFEAFDRRMERMVNLGRYTIRNLILNHVGTSISIGGSNKETIRTLRGNYITWDHSNNTIRGTYQSTIGYKGYINAICSPVPLNEPADNGETWSVNYWFNFGN